MSMERPFSPLLGNDSKASALRRAQSVREIRDARPAPQVALTEASAPPVYSVVQDRPKTPAIPQTRLLSSGGNATYATESSLKTPRKSKSKNKLMRLFG